MVKKKAGLFFVQALDFGEVILLHKGQHPRKVLIQIFGPRGPNESTDKEGTVKRQERKIKKRGIYCLWGIKLIFRAFKYIPPRD